jgi:KaiB domain.
MGLFGGSKYHFRYYVSGETEYSDFVVVNLKRVLDELCPGQYKLEVVNILFKPNIAKQDRVYWTPMFAKVDKKRIVRYVGKFSDVDRLRIALEKVIETE